MGSYAHVVINDTMVFAFKNGVEPTFMLLYKREDVRRVTVTGSERPYLLLQDDDEIDVVELCVPAEMLADRLSAFGFSTQSAREALDLVVSWELSFHESYRDASALKDHFAEEDAVLRDLSLDRWTALVRQRFELGEGPFRHYRETGSLGWLFQLWRDVDPRLLLRAIVDAFPDSEVVLDITDLVEGGWLEGDVDPQEEAREHFGWVLETGSPAIVLAEGKTDIEFLQAALAVRRPHLDGFIRFADFEAKPEGGAPALVKTVRALAAAGVSNTVVALFDNDAAAADALGSFKNDRLPANFHILRYPVLELAKVYPALGPTGLTSMDVNGLACGIEMYLGRDVLTDEDGTLIPVQWLGFQSKIGRYQGELVGKGRVQRRFRQKVERATTDPRSIVDQDWESLDAILALVLECVANSRRDSAIRPTE